MSMAGVKQLVEMREDVAIGVASEVRVLSPAQLTEDETLCVLCQRNPKAPGKSKCHGCRSREYRTKFPERKAFYDLRHSAKRRKIQFTLTMEEFIELVTQTGYMERRGRFYDSLTIDRVNNHLGYTKENVRVITKHHNSCKSDKDNYPF